MIVWHYADVPPSVVLVATIIWRFVINAGELNAEERSDGVKFRRTAAFLGVALLGVGMLVLDHGPVYEHILDSNAFADITDRLGMAVVAPIWLIRLVLTPPPAHKPVGK